MENDLRYAWMQDPNGRGIAYIDKALHSRGVHLTDELRLMLLDEFAAVDARARRAEREECAKVAESASDSNLKDNEGPVRVWGWRDACEHIATAIRARG